MDLNRYKLDNTYVRAILLLWADGVPWPSGARDRVPGAPTQARFSQLGPRHSVADGHAVLPVSARIGLSSGRYTRERRTGFVDRVQLAETGHALGILQRKHILASHHES